jgi:hypothetical protein
VDAGTRRLFVITLVVVVLLAGVAVAMLGGRSDATLEGAKVVTGVIVGVDGSGLGAVRGITLRTDGGELLDFRLERLQNGTEFPPGHLVEHQATSEPVRVQYQEEAGERFALRLDDAPRPT